MGTIECIIRKPGKLSLTTYNISTTYEWVSILQLTFTQRKEVHVNYQLATSKWLRLFLPDHPLKTDTCSIRTWYDVSRHLLSFCTPNAVTRLSYDIGCSARVQLVLLVNCCVDGGLERLRNKLRWVQKPTECSNISTWAFVLQCSCVKL